MRTREGLVVRVPRSKADQQGSSEPGAVSPPHVAHVRTVSQSSPDEEIAAGKILFPFLARARRIPRCGGSRGATNNVGSGADGSVLRVGPGPAVAHARPCVMQPSVLQRCARDPMPGRARAQLAWVGVYPEHQGAGPARGRSVGVLAGRARPPPAVARRRRRRVLALASVVASGLVLVPTWLLRRRGSRGRGGDVR